MLCYMFPFPWEVFIPALLSVHCLVKGVGKAIAKSLCPKFFIPNSGIRSLKYPGLRYFEQAKAFCLCASLKRKIYPCAEK